MTTIDKYDPSQSTAGLRSQLGGFGRRNQGVLLSYVLALALFAVGTGLARGFASPRHLASTIEFAFFIGAVGFGQTLCIITGGIDLSIPYVMTGAAVLTTVLVEHGVGLGWAVLLTVVGAAVVGGVNGAVIAFAGAPPLITTLGMNSVLQGIVLVATNGGIVGGAPPGLKSFAAGSIFGIPTIILLWIVLAALATLFLSWMTAGRKLYAVGANRKAALIAGISIRHALAVPYVLSAVSAGLAGILLAGFAGGAYLGMGDPYLFASAAAVAIGGASLLGGSGHYLGTIAGALTLTFLVGILSLYSLSEGPQLISYGVIVLLTVFVSNQGLRRGRNRE
jgi:ribose transport system permease protein